MSNTVMVIDVSKEILDVMLLDGERGKEHTFKNNEKGFKSLVNWLEKQQSNQAHICLEATGRYSFPVTKYLYATMLKVSMVNPARIKYYRDSLLARNKTDRLDAYVIADFCRTQKPPLWVPATPEQEELKELTRYLDGMNQMVQQEKNRLQAGYSSEIVLEQIRQNLEFLQQQINSMQEKIEHHIEQDEALMHQRDLLVTIPGIANLTAAKLLAEIQDVRRFQNAPQLAAYAGVTPQNQQSGSSVHKKARMSKVGNRYLRKAIFMPALTAKRYNPIVKEFCTRLEKNGKSKSVAVGAAMRKMLHIVYPPDNLDISRFFCWVVHGK